MKEIIGLVVGGFRPFHKGHEALINFAKSNCDKLFVYVAAVPNESIPYKYRLKWVLSTYLDDPQIEVTGDILVEPNFNSSEEKSQWWGNHVKQKFGEVKIDRIFSSEKYGEAFSKSVGAENWVFNEQRNIIPVSGTLIRSNPFKYWDYINNFAKDYFVKKIAIVGTESTGKSVLAKRLAKHYNTVYVEEIGRKLIKDAQNCSIDDLQLVYHEHAKEINQKVRMANKLLFLDTDAKITKSYAKFLFNQELKTEPWVEKANDVDFYIFLSKSALYVQDGERLDIEKRNELEKFHDSFYKNVNTMLYVKTVDMNTRMSEDRINDLYEKRFNAIVKFINEFYFNSSTILETPGHYREYIN